jgi:hypothetical protein
MEVLERRARVDAELFDEECPRRSIRRESVGLSTRAVEREHEVPAESFPQRVAGDQRFEPRRHVGMPAKRELRLDVVLHRREAFLFEPKNVRLSERLEDKLRQRGATPEVERST